MSYDRGPLVGMVGYTRMGPYSICVVFVFFSVVLRFFSVHFSIRSTHSLAKVQLAVERVEFLPTTATFPSVYHFSIYFHLFGCDGEYERFQRVPNSIAYTIRRAIRRIYICILYSHIASSSTKSHVK